MEFIWVIKSTRQPSEKNSKYRQTTDSAIEYLIMKIGITICDEKILQSSTKKILKFFSCACSNECNNEWYLI